VPRCYLLAVCSGSSVDQQTNNATLFNLVEQINVAPGAPPPPRGLIPLEIHAYFQLEGSELDVPFEMRFVLVAATGLETPTDPQGYRSATVRYRTRTVGVPFPPVTGAYELRVDFRASGEHAWRRDPLRWPLSIVEFVPKPHVTH
jgi:hypothetical protein